MLHYDKILSARYETYVAQNLLSILSAKWQEASLQFWAVQGRHEMDFVIESGRNCIALELKSSARWQDKDLSGLKAFPVGLLPPQRFSL
jgi:predicted AAA+ superfamily ATPase